MILVLKELMYREKIKGLSTSERKTLTSAKQIVVSELVLSEVADVSDIESILNDTVDRKSTRLNSSHNRESRMPSSA